MPPSRKFLKELRELEKTVGRDEFWAAAEEAERNLPKPGRKPGPLYRIEEAVSSMRSLKAATPGRSWHDIAKEVGKEFSIAAETLRKEERDRRETALPAAATPAKPEDSKPEHPPRRRVISRTAMDFPDVNLEELERAWARYTHLDPLMQEAQKGIAAYLASQEEMERLRARAELVLRKEAERTEMAVAALLEHQRRLFGELVAYPDWRTILDGLGLGKK